MVRVKNIIFYTIATIATITNSYGSAYEKNKAAYQASQSKASKKLDEKSHIDKERKSIQEDLLYKKCLENLKKQRLDNSNEGEFSEFDLCKKIRIAKNEPHLDEESQKKLSTVSQKRLDRAFNQEDTEITTPFTPNKNLPESELEKNLALQSCVIPIIIVEVGGGAVTGPIIPVAVIGGLGIKWIIDYTKNKKKAKQKNNSKNDTNNKDSKDSKDPKDPKKPKDPKDKKSAYPCPPLDDEKKNNFNEKYENNSKHHKNSPDGIGKPPLDGPKGLSESLKVPGKDRQRVTVQNEKIVVFKEHEPGKWHGYIEENYNNLEESAKDALYNAGLIRNRKTGKI